MQQLLWLLNSIKTYIHASSTGTTSIAQVQATLEDDLVAAVVNSRSDRGGAHYPLNVVLEGL